MFISLADFDFRWGGGREQNEGGGGPNPFRSHEYIPGRNFTTRALGLGDGAGVGEEGGAEIGRVWTGATARPLG